eukprot:6668460-Pyramimonas_sp.AAC.1
MKRPLASPADGVDHDSKAARLRRGSPVSPPPQLPSSTETASPQKFPCSDTAYQHVDVISISSDAIVDGPSLFVKCGNEKDVFWIRLCRWELQTWPWKHVFPDLLEEYLENLSHSEDLPFTE